jgi:high-affinity K+ transport system ATPase subunit B
MAAVDTLIVDKTGTLTMGNRTAALLEWRGLCVE